jgi:cation:H+ antiporter
MSITTLLVPGLLLDGSIERIEGALLVLSIAAYVSLTIWQSRSAHNTDSTASSVPVISDSLLINLLLSAGSLAMLVLGSGYFVDASVSIAASIGVPPAIVGLSAAALGSSLPELTASIIAARHGHPEMAAGNLIGSNIFNLLLILGVTASIRPLSSASLSILAS